MIRKSALIYLASILVFLSSAVYAATQAILLNVTGPIGPATQDYIQRGLDKAHTQNAKLVILRLDTPGGLDSSMRGINKGILASPVPVVTYVAPAGARAASAGTFILYASHIAAMAPGTNVGAASPVHLGEIPSPQGSSSKEKSISTMDRKAMQDASAYIRSLAKLRGRNAEWAEKAVTEAVSISADEALKLNVIDLIANNENDLLKAINGRAVKINDMQQTIQSNDLTVNTLAPDWRYQFLSIITDPSVAYILLLIGIYGIFFEFYNPGFILPGVAGAICLVLALYAFQLLPINYTGFALLLLGILFMVMEMYVSTFGTLAIGGLIAFIVGSVFLLDTQVPGFNIAWQVILAMSLISGVFFLILLNLTIGSIRKKIVSGRESLIGEEGRVLEFDNYNGIVQIQGEIWQANSKIPLRSGQKIRVTQVSGLVLTIEPVTNKENNFGD